MKSFQACALMFALSMSPAYGQLVPIPIHPFEHLTWKTKSTEALRSVLKDPPPALRVDEKTGAAKIVRGRFLYERAEMLFDMRVRCAYAFSTGDSLLRYVLATYFEADRIPGSSHGGRDTLWNRIARRYGPFDKESTEWPTIQRTWFKGGTTIVCTKVNGLAKTLVLSITPAKKN